MTPRQRVITALKHREPDLVPWGEVWIDYNVFEDVLGRPSYFHGKMKETIAWWEGRDAEIITSCDRDVVDLTLALGLDVATVEVYPRSQYILGSRYNVPMKQIDYETYVDQDGSLWRVSSATHELMPFRLNPDVYTPPTMVSLEKAINDVEKNGVPKPDDWQWSMVRNTVTALKDTHIVACLAPDIGFPSFGQTDEEKYLNMALHPEMLGRIAELAGRRAIAELKYYAEEGVDALFPCGDYGCSNGLLASPSIFTEHVFPWIKAYCDEAHRLGMYVFKHCCGRTIDIFGYFIKAGYDAYQSIQPTAGMDIRELKDRFGTGITLWGGAANESLIGGTPQDVENDVLYAFEGAAAGGGYILGASHSLAVGTSLENLMMMKNCREKYGTYPISHQQRTVVSGAKI